MSVGVDSLCSEAEAGISGAVEISCHIGSGKNMWAGVAAGCWLLGHDGATSAQLAAVAGRARHVMEGTEAGQSRAH